MNQQPLHYRYRPRRMRQIRGQDKAVSSVRALLERQDRGAIWIEGPSGTGKTVLAECVAAEVGASLWSRRGAQWVRCPAWNLDELDGHSCGVGEVRRLDDQARRGWLGSRVVMVNEAHGLTAAAVQGFLTLLERIPRGWWFVFTTTENSPDLFGSFASPFASRCATVRLTAQGLAPVFARLGQAIARREGCNGEPLSWYVNQLKRFGGNNMRQLLTVIAQRDRDSDSG